MTIRDGVVRKNLPLLSSFLRLDKKCSELGPRLITKAGSAPAHMFLLSDGTRIDDNEYLSSLENGTELSAQKNKSKNCRSILN